MEVVWPTVHTLFHPLNYEGLPFIHPWTTAPQRPGMGGGQRGLPCQQPLMTGGDLLDKIVDWKYFTEGAAMRLVRALIGVPHLHWGAEGWCGGRSAGVGVGRIS